MPPPWWACLLCPRVDPSPRVWCMPQVGARHGNPEGNGSERSRPGCVHLRLRYRRVSSRPRLEIWLCGARPNVFFFSVVGIMSGGFPAVRGSGSTHAAAEAVVLVIAIDDCLLPSTLSPSTRVAAFQARHSERFHGIFSPPPPPPPLMFFFSLRSPFLSHACFTHAHSLPFSLAGWHRAES